MQREFNRQYGSALKHTFTCIVARPTGCDKTAFAARLLQNASVIIVQPPNTSRGITVNGSIVRETKFAPNVQAFGEDCRGDKQQGSGVVLSR